MNTLSEILSNYAHKTKNMGGEKVTGHFSELEALAELQQREAELVNGVLDRIQESLDNHTTPEGHDLLTRSYINNTITFERERASKMGVRL